MNYVSNIRFMNITFRKHGEVFHQYRSRKNAYSGINDKQKDFVLNAQNIHQNQ